MTSSIATSTNHPARELLGHFDTDDCTTMVSPLLRHTSNCYEFQYAPNAVATHISVVNLCTDAHYISDVG